MSSTWKWSRCAGHPQKPPFGPLTWLCSWIFQSFRGRHWMPPPIRTAWICIPSDKGLRGCLKFFPVPGCLFTFAMHSTAENSIWVCMVTSETFVSEISLGLYPCPGPSPSMSVTCQALLFLYMIISFYYRVNVRTGKWGVSFYLFIWSGTYMFQEEIS